MRWGAFVATLLLVTSAPGAEASSLVLGGPEVTKLDWNTRGLRSADVNGDGRQDLLVLNNDDATIELLLQQGPEAKPARQRSLRSNRWEPVVEDARFEKESFSVGITLYDLAVGDLDADGRADLVYTGSPHALTIQYRTAAGGWREHRVTPAPDASQLLASLAIGDVDGDQRADLVMLGQSELAVYRQKGDGTLDVPQRFPLPDENGYGLQLQDFDGDGRLDLQYVNGREPKGSLRVRLQTPSAAFGPELAFPLDRIISPVEAVRTQVGTGTAASLQPAWAYIAGPVGQMRVVRFTPEGSEEDKSLPLPRTFRPRLSGRAPAAYAVGDFDGDGHRDIAVSDSGGAQLSVYFREAQGAFTEAQVYPSLSEAQSLAAIDWDADGRDELFVASAKERIVGVARISAERRLDYPAPLAVAGKPIALAAGRLGERPAIAVAMEDKGSHSVRMLSPAASGEVEEVRSVALPKLRTDPSGIAFWDANQDGRADLAVFVPRDPLRLYLQSSAEEFEDASTSPGFRQGLVDNLEPTAVTFADVTGDSFDEMITANRGFARALRLTPEGGLQIVRQFNARGANAEISATLLLRPTGSDQPEVVLYDRRAEELTRLRADEAGVYQVASTQTADRLDVVATASSANELLVFGSDRFWWMPLDRPEFVSKPVSAHVTDLPGVRYAFLRAADFDGDGRSEIVGIDPERNVVEILVASESAEEWTSQLHFVVFEIDPHRQNGNRPDYEPREAVVADVTSDGRPDLVLLVHDRVLLYPQQSSTTASAAQPSGSSP